jgi:hypothetical protein
VYFQELQRKLIGLARERVRAGQCTERGLARLCDISQPHMGINILDSVKQSCNDGVRL